MGLYSKMTGSETFDEVAGRPKVSFGSAANETCALLVVATSINSPLFFCGTSKILPRKRGRVFAFLLGFSFHPFVVHTPHTSTNALLVAFLRISGQLPPFLIVYLTNFCLLCCRGGCFGDSYWPKTTITSSVTRFHRSGIILHLEVLECKVLNRRTSYKSKFIRNYKKKRKKRLLQNQLIYFNLVFRFRIKYFLTCICVALGCGSDINLYIHTYIYFLRSFNTKGKVEYLATSTSRVCVCVCLNFSICQAYTLIIIKLYLFLNLEKKRKTVKM